MFRHGGGRRVGIEVSVLMERTGAAAEAAAPHEIELPVGRRVLEAAVDPERVEATLEL